MKLDFTGNGCIEWQAMPQQHTMNPNGKKEDIFIVLEMWLLTDYEFGSDFL